MDDEAEALVQDILGKYGSVSSRELALQMAEGVEGIEVEGSEVKNVESVEAIEGLVEKLKDGVGPVALRFARKAVEEADLSQEFKEKLPDTYKRSS
ncbi:MAG: hypothetical protein ABEJ93_03715 [Candidatus Nanohalobium sp.]